MRAIVSILIIFMTVSCTRTKEQEFHAPLSWRADSAQQPTAAEMKRMAPSVDRLLGLGLSTLENQPISPEAKWKLRGLMWNLGLSADGILGLLFSSGSVGFEAIFSRKGDLTSPTPSLQPTSLGALEFADADAELEIPPQVDSTIQNLVAKGRLHNESHLHHEIHRATEKFREMIRALQSVPDSLQHFYLHGLQLEMSFDAEGNIVAAGGAGIELRIRLNWVREKLGALPGDGPKTEFGERMKTQLVGLFRALSGNMDALVSGPESDSIRDSGFRLSEIKPSIGISETGEVGFISIPTEWLGTLRFHRKKEGVPPLVGALLGKDETIPVFSENAVIQVPRAPFTKGMTRAMKISRFFADRARKFRSARWALNEFSTSFEITHTASIGLVSAEAIAGLEITFSHEE